MTKKVLKLLCVAIMLTALFLCGCNSTTPKNVTTKFSADFQAEYRQMKIKGSLSLAGRGMISINVTYPETLRGLSVTYKNSEMLLCREGLQCSADEAYIPSNSFPNTVYLIMTGLENGRQSFSGQSGSCDIYNLKTSLGNCMVYFDEQGSIVKAEISKTKFSIAFSNVKAIQ